MVDFYTWRSERKYCSPIIGQHLKHDLYVANRKEAEFSKVRLGAETCKMPTNVNILQENLQRLDDLNSVLQMMAEIDRIPVSQACKELTEYMQSVPDPLLYPEYAANSPYMKKAKAKKTCLCF